MTMDPSDLPRRTSTEITARYAQIRDEIHLFEREVSGGKTGLTLSHWLDWELWELVKDYFVEVEEGDWYCREADAAAVEEALHVLPQNRWQARKAAE